MRLRRGFPWKRVRNVRDALGLPSRVVIVVPWDERWPGLFEVAAAELRAAAGDALLAIEHVGSTAVRGLAAKPVLDMLAGVANFEAARGLVPALQQLGYEYRPDNDIPDRHYFRRGPATGRTHHLSLAEPAAEHYRNTILFRDALRADPALASAYAALKYELGARYPRDREAYLDGKTAFVLEVLARARGGSA
jgi:GrpB-like predicted nucleotidyltransferase (UPF0157 family)